MTIPTDPMAPITRLSSLGFIEDQGNNTFKALYTPNLTSDQVVAIPVTDTLPGAVVFNTDTEELETYTAAGFWLPILTAESDINVTNITTETLTTNNISSESINNDGTITTVSMNVISAVSAGAILADEADFTNVTLSEGGVLAGSVALSDTSVITCILGNSAGTGATITIKGSIQSGQIAMRCGTSPAAAGIVGTFTIPSDTAQYFTGSYAVVITAADGTTSDVPIYTNTSNNLFILGIGPTTLSTGTLYNWNYHIIGSVKDTS